MSAVKTFIPDGLRTGWGQCSLPFDHMHDGVTCHTARVTVNLLYDINVNLLPWPFISPDPNLIENTLQKGVYHPQKYFSKSCLQNG